MGVVPSELVTLTSSQVHGSMHKSNSIIAQSWLTVNCRRVPMHSAVFYLGSAGVAMEVGRRRSLVYGIVWRYYRWVFSVAREDLEQELECLIWETERDSIDDIFEVWRLAGLSVRRLLGSLGFRRVCVGGVSRWEQGLSLDEFEDWGEWLAGRDEIGELLGRLELEERLGVLDGRSRDCVVGRELLGFEGDELADLTGVRAADWLGDEGMRGLRRHWAPGAGVWRPSR